MVIQLTTDVWHIHNYIMKSNRQRTCLAAQRLKFPLKGTNGQIPRLVELIPMAQQQQVTLTCNYKLALQTALKHNMSSRASVRVDIGVQMTAGCVLLRCLEQFTTQPKHKDYVFCALTHGCPSQPNTRPFQPSTSRRVDTDRSSRQCPNQRESSKHIFGQISDRLVKDIPQGQFYSHQPRQRAMFTVEQAKESQVSGSISQQNIASNAQPINEPQIYQCEEQILEQEQLTKDNNMETITPQGSHNDHNHAKQPSLPSHNKENESHNSIRHSHNGISQQDQPQAPVVQIAEPTLRFKPLMSAKQSFRPPPEGQVSDETKFSFAQAMKQGIVQPSEPQPLLKASNMIPLRLAGDAQLESARKRAPCSEINANQLSSMSQLSSILSECNKGALSGVKKDPDNDSLKGDIEEMNKCVSNAQTQRERIELESLAQKHEEHIDECIKISEKPSELSTVNPSSTNNFSTTPEYEVRYNVRMLDKRQYQTSVVRVSPYRFRKKEEVVKELIRHEVVKKESDSINIA